MDAATAATLFLTLVWPNGAETTSERLFPTVAACKAHAARATAAPRQDGKPFTKRAECMPHYKFSN